MPEPSQTTIYGASEPLRPATAPQTSVKAEPLFTAPQTMRGQLAMPTDTDWRATIAEAARATLEAHGVGAVIVGLPPRKRPDMVSRFYARADYRDSRQLAAVAWGRARRLFDADSESNYYVVQRYDDGSIIVYNGPHSILWEAEHSEDLSASQREEVARD